MNLSDHISAHRPRRPTTHPQQPASEHTEKHGAYSYTPSPKLRETLDIQVIFKKGPQSTYQRALDQSDIREKPETLKEWLEFGKNYGDLKAKKYEKKSQDSWFSKNEKQAISHDATAFSNCMKATLKALNEGNHHAANTELSTFLDSATRLLLNHTSPQAHRHMLLETASITRYIKDTLRASPTLPSEEMSGPPTYEEFKDRHRIAISIHNRDNMSDISDLTEDSV